MEKNKHPSLMEHQHMYKRTWREPTPTLEGDTFAALWKKQRLAEIRDAVLRGDWPHPLPTDSDSSVEGGDSADTSSTSNSRHRHHPHHSDDDPDFEEALQEAADAQLGLVLASLQEQQQRELAASRAAAAEIEEQHTATQQQIGDIQGQLDELKREKHELFQQLKLVNQAAAKEAAAAAAAAQQAAFQQQQRQWQQQQQQQQQMPPPPSLPQHLQQQQQQQGVTPFHAASYGGQPFSASAGMYPPQQPQSQPTTPRVAGQPLQTAGSGLMSPAARGIWPSSSPQLQPPPPPPRGAHGDGLGSSGGGSTPSYQQQQHTGQRMGASVSPAFQQQQQQYALGRQGSWAAGGGPSQQHQQHQHQQSLGRALSDVQHWASSSSERGGQRLDRLGSDRPECLSSSGFMDAFAAAGAAAFRAGWREGYEQERAQQQAQQGGGSNSPYGRSPREGPFGRAGRLGGAGELQAPDSPEEGEALPPGPPGARGQAPAAGAGGAGGAGGQAKAFAEPPQPSPRVGGGGLDRAVSGGMPGYMRVHAADAAAEEAEGGGPGGARMPLTGLRRSSSGGSSSGLHALASPAGLQGRLPPRESPRGGGLPSTPSDPLPARRMGGMGGGGGPYRGGYIGGRGREEGGGLHAPWQADRRRSSADGWDRYAPGGGPGQQLPQQQYREGGAPHGGPGAGKPWGRGGLPGGYRG